MKHSLRALALLLAFLFLFPRPSQGIGEDNPTGVTGQFNGNITTAGSYDPYTGNATRVVDDIIVPGSVGAYPLKWTRVINTRNPSGWSSGYGWGMSVRSSSDPGQWNDENPGYEGPAATVRYPDGRILDFYGNLLEGYAAFDSSDTTARLQYSGVGQDFTLLLPDGGKVTFQATPTHVIGGIQHYSTPVATSIIDPYGQVTTLIRDGVKRLWRIVEPGERYLEITYATIPVQGSPKTVIDFVRAFDGRGNLTQTVDYDYDAIVFDGYASLYLARVNYDDLSQATYTYRSSNALEVRHGMIETCRDVRFAGAMKNIKYEYMSSVGRNDVGFGQIKAERNATNGQMVSEIVYPSPTSVDPAEFYRRTEQRGDNPAARRVFQYSFLAGMPETYTDFESPNHVTSTLYAYSDGNRSYKIVTDARQKQSMIERQIVPAIAVMSVTHHDHSQVSFGYTDNNYPYYLAWLRDENQKTTTYTRNQNTHQIERIDYPDGGYETFTYDNNPFGLVHEHLMTSGGTEVFEYDNRGLRTTYTPPATPAISNRNSIKPAISIMGPEMDSIIGSIGSGM